MKKIIQHFLLAISMLLSFHSQAYIPTNTHGKPIFKTKKSAKVAVLQDCAVSKSQIDINVNNVRARLQGGGDIWWDFKDGGYIVPNVPAGSPPVSSIFAAAIWMGGIDGGGNLKTACNMYRGASGGQGNDWFPGPLDAATGTTDPTTCNSWDRHFSVYKTEIETFKTAYKNATKDATGKVTDSDFKKKIPKSVIGWPAKGNPYFTSINGFSISQKRMAGFYDQNADNIYDPFDGDYPAIIIGHELCEQPDQFVWWIFNDAGGVHTQTKSEAMRMEVHATSFAYATDDDLNNMTFQSYRTMNRNSEDFDSCFLSIFVDFDLGCPLDDYLGCDITIDYMGNKRTMAYVYNADNEDGDPKNSCPGLAATYGKDLPIMGIDLVQLPLDTDGKEVGSTFMFFNRSDLFDFIPAVTDPVSPEEYYRYMNATWRDGTPLSVGGTGYTQNPSPSKITKYAFADEPSAPSGWSMNNLKFPIGDRRALLSAGPFKMLAGSIKNTTYSLPWVSHQGGGAVDLTSLRRASTRAREMFNRCFELYGPSAPNVNMLGIDKAVVLNLENKTNVGVSEDYFEDKYSEQSYLLPNNAKNDYYKFEGYKIYQLNTDSLYFWLVNLDKSPNARLVAITDRANGIKKIYNWTAKKDPNDSTFPNFTSELQADMDDKGIKRSFLFDKDAFATGADKSLVNGKKYYYIVVPFGYNNFEPFNKLTGNGQKQQYVKGYLGTKIVTIVPNAAISTSKYGVEFPITRYDGVGAGGNFLDMTDDMYGKIFDKTFDGTITYKAGKGPITVKVFDPSKLQDGEYSVKLTDSNMNDGVVAKDAKWVLQRKGDQPITSASTIEKLNEQLILEYGLSVSIVQQNEPCSLRPGKKGMIGQEVSFKNNKPWLKTITDEDETIENGTANSFDYIKNENGEELNSLDCSKDSIFDKTTLKFAPYAVCDYKLRTAGAANPPFTIPYVSPAWFNNNNNAYYLKSNTNALAKLPNVDIILTPDKSKWSRCVVIETNNSMYADQGLETEKSGVLKGRSFDMRAGKSVGSDTDPNAPSDGTLGKSWFPGYAIDVETGQRLNVIFGENSGYDPDNQILKDVLMFKKPLAGRDMIWNPTSDVFVKSTIPSDITAANFVAGCGHYIYVLNQAYDGCKDLYEIGKVGVIQFSRNIAKSTAWTAMPYLSEDATLLSYQNGLIPSECSIKLRVNNPYKVLDGVGTNNFHPSYGFSIDKKTLQTNTLANGNEDKFNVYPNPISSNGGSLTLSNLPDVCSINIYSMDGKLHFQTRRKENNEDKTLVISTLDFASAGIYLVVVRTANGIQSRKLVVY